MTESSMFHQKPSPLYWVSALLIVCGTVLAMNPLPFHSPVTAAVPVEPSSTDPQPLRQPQPEPCYPVAVYTYRCSDCHAIIPDRSADAQGTRLQHREIELEHGINTRCFNCHQATNRDALAGDGGSEIAWEQPQLLCAKCHGPVYRDWQHGSHGRTNGYWNTRLGVQSRLKCIECHDPHQPPFPHLAPAPPPHTLRMGPQAATADLEFENPLRYPAAAAGSNDHRARHAQAASHEGH